MGDLELQVLIDPGEGVPLQLEVLLGGGQGESFVAGVGLDEKQADQGHEVEDILPGGGRLEPLEVDTDVR